MAEKLAGYGAIVLTDESASRLKGLAVHKDVHCHHLTLAFRPSEEEWAEGWGKMVGQTVQFKVVGIVADDRGQAVLAELPSGVKSNFHPHVTVSCAPGTHPKYSNDLVAEKANEVASLELMLEGVVAFVPFN